MVPLVPMAPLVTALQQAMAQLPATILKPKMAPLAQMETSVQMAPCALMKPRQERTRPRMATKRVHIRKVQKAVVEVLTIC